MGKLKKNTQNTEENIKISKFFIKNNLIDKKCKLTLASDIEKANINTRRELVCLQDNIYDKLEKFVNNLEKEFSILIEDSVFEINRFKKISSNKDNINCNKNK